MPSESTIKIANKTSVNQADILYLEAIYNYTCIHTLQKQLVSSRTLKLFSQRVEASTFIKINRGIIINTKYIKCINQHRIAPFIELTNGKTLTISRRQYNKVISRLSC
jgi:DNA-binding LytR/AlgR family response regulator